MTIQDGGYTEVAVSDPYFVSHSTECEQMLLTFNLFTRDDRKQIIRLEIMIRLEIIMIINNKIRKKYILFSL
jgi:hypothetical protein